jgi:hypothetical protein
MRGAPALAVLAALAAGCGGGERQDANEPSGTFRVQVVRASFPARQHIAQTVVLRLQVRNADRRDLSNVAVTVQTRAPVGAAPVAFGQGSGPGSDLADTGRPVWILDKGPTGGDTADARTWLAGPLRAGESRTLVWRLVAVKAGTYTLAYRVFPGLNGKAEPARGRTAGTLRVRIIDRPVPARVGADGEVVRG